MTNFFATFFLFRGNLGFLLETRVKKLTEAQKEAGWEFIFLGANIDSAETAAGIGISKERAVNFHADSEGIDINFAGIAKAMTEFRSCDSLSEDWKEEIEADFLSRKKRRV